MCQGSRPIAVSVERGLRVVLAIVVMTPTISGMAADGCLQAPDDETEGISTEAAPVMTRNSLIKLARALSRCKTRKVSTVPA